MTTATIAIAASRYADHDDCLSAAAEDIAEQRDLAGWDLSPRWDDEEQRERILLDLPSFAVLATDHIA